MGDLSFIHYVFIASKLQIQQINGHKINLVIDLGERYGTSNLSSQIPECYAASIWRNLQSKEGKKNAMV